MYTRIKFKEMVPFLVFHTQPTASVINAYAMLMRPKHVVIALHGCLILDPRAFAFLTARKLWGTLRKRSQNLAMRVPQRMLSAKSKWRPTWMQLSRLP